MRLSLITKTAFATSIVLLVCMIVFTSLNFDFMEHLMIEETVADSERLSETIINSTHHQMLENNLADVFLMMKEIGKQKGIQRIRLVNKEGKIIYSTDETEIGTLLDKKAEACSMCHEGETPKLDVPSMNRSRFFVDRSGTEVMGLAKAIYNSERCYTAPCHFHPASFRVLGVLDITTSLEAMRKTMETYRYKLGAVSVLIVATLWISITLFMMFVVNRPLRELLSHIGRMSRGDLDSPPPRFTSHELATLSDSFATLAQHLKGARKELEDWAHTLELRVEERSNELQKVQNQLIRTEKLASLGELVAGIAHEINNPLTGILMYASLLQEEPRLDPALRGDVDIIVSETERCAKIVRGLLEFSREKNPVLEPTSIPLVMNAALSILRSQSLFQDVTFIIDYEPDIPDIPVAANMIEQVFVNMLVNAGQAMPDGGTLSIRIQRHPSQEMILVEISDTGCGIPEEHLQKIFDPFFTTKENRGTGLGLSVSYRIIENHGGSIDVKSSPGKGTTFTILLPIEASTPAESMA